MTLFLCKLWPYLAGGLIGWLLAGWLARRLKYGEPPVEKIVEKYVDKVVDNPAHLERINQFEAEIQTLKSSTASTTTSSNTSTYGIAGAASAASTAAVSASSPVAQGSTVDLAAAKAAGFRLKQKNGQDDFTVVEGIGPKINEIIHEADIHFYASLAATSVDDIQKMLDNAGPSYKLAKPGTWPAQAKMAAENKWEALKVWQDELDGGQ